MGVTIMPRPAHRTRSRRKVIVRTPGGRVTIHYEPRKPGPAKCAICGKPLNGVPREIPSVLKKLAKTEKRPERPYGGYICPECLSRLLREAVRATIH